MQPLTFLKAHGQAQPPTPADEYQPAAILEIDLAKPLPVLSATNQQTGEIYQRALCLVRLHSQPIGRVEIALTHGQARPEEYSHLIWNALSARINKHLLEDGFPATSSLPACGLHSSVTPRCLSARAQFLAHAPFVSVIIPTHNRPDRLQSCLRALLALDYPRYEIVVVDNAPNGPETARAIQQTCANHPLVRYVREDRAGGSWARNRGISAARGEILAFADDDIIVDAHWLTALVQAFTVTDDVACVTGLLLPLELETPAQFWIEEYGGFGKGFQRHIFDLKTCHPPTPLHPFAPGHFGTGACMAFTAAFLRSAGGFDVALGPATNARGGEDLTMFFEAIVRGHKLVYEPAAIGYHPHHRAYSTLKNQIYSYGIGISSFMVRNIAHHPKLLGTFLARLPYGLYFILGANSSKNRKKTSHYPEELTKLELKGMVYGPLAYLKSYWQTRHARQSLTQVRPQAAWPAGRGN